MKPESVMSTAKIRNGSTWPPSFWSEPEWATFFSGLSQNSVYFLNVSEALAMPAEKLTQARLFGSVSEKDLVHDPSAMGVSFFVQDKDDPAQAIRVHYKGAVPDTFKVGVEVILEGSFAADTRIFEATSLLTKCPSKYEKNEKGRMRPPGFAG